MMERNAEIGEKIHYFRQENGMTQGQLAQAFGKTRRTIQKYEAGECGLTVVELERLAKILSVHPSYLLGYDHQLYAKVKVQSRKRKIRMLIPCTVKQGYRRGKK